MILFFNLGQIATIAAIAVLLIQGFTHTGHLFRYRQTGANRWWILAAITGSFGAAWFAIAYTSRSMPHIGYYIAGIFFLAFIFEILLRLFNDRTVRKQILSAIEAAEKNVLKRLEG